MIPVWAVLDAALDILDRNLQGDGEGDASGAPGQQQQPVSFAGYYTELDENRAATRIQTRERERRVQLGLLKPLRTPSPPADRSRGPLRFVVTVLVAPLPLHW